MITNADERRGSDQPVCTEPRVQLIEPYGGSLVDLVVSEDEVEDLRRAATRLPSMQITRRAENDLELLATGAFSPLRTFVGRADYESILDTMRLAGGALFPIPITLPIAVGAEVSLDRKLAIRNSRNELMAVMDVREIFEWDREAFASAVLGTTDARHPLVAELERWGSQFLSGPLKVLALPNHADFRRLRKTPVQTRRELEQLGRSNVVAFQTRNPLHRAHEELTKRAMRDVDGSLLLHPVVGLTRPGDIDHFTRVRTYQVLVDGYYDASQVVLGLIPLAMRMAGPREALWHAIIRRNYGVNHFIVGRGHASPGVGSDGKPIYGAYDAQDLVRQHEAELGVTMVAFEELVYLPDEQRYEERSRVPPSASTLSISGTDVREYLDAGRKLPDWFTRSEVADILASAYPPKTERGVCLWFTGLSGAGKSTIAEAVTARIQERGRQVTLLDGDVVRTHLSAGLGFSKADRDTNVRRIGFVAAEIVQHGGVVVCAAVSPYRLTRNDVRRMVGTERFVEIYVDTPLDVCERRDPKGMYARARRGELIGFTGIDDPYEAPIAPELVVDGANVSVEESTDGIIGWLLEHGLVADLSADTLLSD